MKHSWFHQLVLIEGKRLGLTQAESWAAVAAAQDLHY